MTGVEAGIPLVEVVTQNHGVYYCHPQTRYGQTPTHTAYPVEHAARMMAVVEAARWQMEARSDRLQAALAALDAGGETTT